MSAPSPLPRPTFRRRCVVALVVATAVALLSVPSPTPVRADVADATVAAFGGAREFGGVAGPLSQPVVAMAPTPTGGGTWLAAVDGGVFDLGDAPFLGSVGGTPLQASVVGIAATPAGRGYWLVASDGGVFAFGDARFLGSTGGIPLQRPIVGMAATPTGGGYWLVASDGGVFAFGDARFHGSTGGEPLQSPVVGIAATPLGDGYWVAAADGGIFAFGAAPFLGSTGGTPLTAPVVGIARTPTGDGYWLVASDGGVFDFGGATFAGSAAPLAPRVAVAMAASPTGGYWVLHSPQPPHPPLPPGSGAGRRIVYSNSGQRVWIVEGGEQVVGSWPVSGRRGVPSAGTYRVFSKSRVTRTASGNASMEFMVRFARGRTLAIGFHAIPVTDGGRSFQTESELGQYRSAGCVRQARADAIRLWDFAPVGTTVVVTP